MYYEVLFARVFSRYYNLYWQLFPEINKDD
jgi:hypothetical protein